MLQWSITFKEFAEFTEFTFYLGKTPLTYILHIIHIYRSHTKFAKVMFLHVSVILSRGGIPACIADFCPLEGEGWYPSMHCRSPGPHPGEMLRGLAWEVSRPTPRRKLRGVTWGGRSLGPADGYCCGRYASYWNALLLMLLSLFCYIVNRLQ